MSPEPQKVQAIFHEAVEQHAPAEWPAFLDQACAGDVELRGAVEALLRGHEQANSLLDEAAPSSATMDEVKSVIPGTVIGSYKLIEQIGEGGMGTVWMAQQTEPVKRVVALKLIKAGMDSKQVIARFEAERQALALMDHLNIAKVLDAGATGAGRPYFVMDLVKGVPITKYCDEHHLTPRQRLELFLPVCQAVQHAHQKGIIHRDLKPSNVLVALYDGKPVPKVIDFGVAKAAGQPLTEQTLVTGFGAIVGTLEYMSPEQAEVNQLDIDTRSDISGLTVNNPGVRTLLRFDPLGSRGACIPGRVARTWKRHGHPGLRHRRRRPRECGLFLLAGILGRTSDGRTAEAPATRSESAPRWQDHASSRRRIDARRCDPAR
jgi:serine/threonine protein kinase